MSILARLISWLNGGMNVLFNLLHGPMAVLPAWLSLALISAVVGIAMLILFKYTSNQTAIGRLRSKIKARLLAMKLYKDNIPVVLKSQVQIFAAVILLLIHSIPPIFVLILPVGLLLGQLGRWYQVRPLRVKEQAVLIMELSDSGSMSIGQVILIPTPAAEVITGPVQVPSEHRIYWQIQANQAGIHQLKFDVAGIQVQKELAAGQDFIPVSVKRPSLDIADLILYPAEKPFPPSFPVHWIQIHYPDRIGPVTGSDTWIISFLIISMISAVICKPIFRVKI